MSAPESIEQFYRTIEFLCSEFNVCLQEGDLHAIQQKLAELDILLQYYPSFENSNSELQMSAVSESLLSLQSSIMHAIDLLNKEQNQVVDLLANIKKSKRISSVYQQSISNDE